MVAKGVAVWRGRGEVWSRGDGVGVDVSALVGSGEQSNSSVQSAASTPLTSRVVGIDSDCSDRCKAQDKAVVQYAQEGEFEKAVQLLKAIRDANLKPSIGAYVSTIEACRREHLFDYATALLRDMYTVCMPSNLIQKYAAVTPNDPNSTQTEKVFHILLMMENTGIKPIEETFRAVLCLCRREDLWPLSLLLLEMMRNDGIVPGKFVWDEVCTVLFKNGFPEVATMIFESALDGDWSEPIDASKEAIDLHSFTASTALAMVRISLLDIVRKPSSRCYHDVRKTLQIITGQGNNSKDGEAVIKPQVLEMLTNMGLEPRMAQNNEGCIVVSSDSLQAYIERSSKGKLRAGD